MEEKGTNNLLFFKIKIIKTLDFFRLKLKGYCSCISRIFAKIESFTLPLRIWMWVMCYALKKLLSKILGQKRTF